MDDLLFHEEDKNAWKEGIERNSMTQAVSEFKKIQMSPFCKKLIRITFSETRVTIQTPRCWISF
jgi:hypothetical protein